MFIKLLYHTPLTVLILAIRTSKNSFNYSNITPLNFTSSDILQENDINLIKKLIKLGHHSVLEHINYNFYIKNITRLCLQELVRHRIASYTVKSSRSTLKEIRNLKNFEEKDLDKFYNTKYLDNFGKQGLFLLTQYLIYYDDKEVNDVVKYLLPESFYTELILTINVRSLRNFFKLRTHKTAHMEIRELAYKIYEKLPIEHKFMFEDVIYKDK